MRSILVPDSDGVTEDLHSRAIFYDGTSARRREVFIALNSDEISIAESGHEIATWRYADLTRQDAPAGMLRLASAVAGGLARLEISDSELASEIVRRAGSFSGRTPGHGRAAITVTFWSLAAAASLIVTAIYIVPLLADRITPLVPASLERRLGEGVDNQVRAVIGPKTCANTEGSRVLRALSGKLLEGVSTPIPIEIGVLQSSIPNALALPGGRIYLFSGLLDRSEDVDEVAGVLAHEIGHVVHRDGLRVLIQNGGTSFLLGLLFGDLFGASAIILVGKTLVDSAYSREAERAADNFAASRMLELNRSPRALGVILARLMKEKESKPGALAILQSHPLSEERLAALSKSEPMRAGSPLLSDVEWRALREICKSS
jgi:Zn-dependent protease with chaperone function